MLDEQQQAQHCSFYLFHSQELENMSQSQAMFVQFNVICSTNIGEYMFYEYRRVRCYMIYEDQRLRGQFGDSKDEQRHR